MIGLEYIFKRFNMTSKEVSEMLGIKNQSVNDWCKGKRKIPAKRQLELKAIFGLDCYLFLKDEAGFNYVERAEIERAYAKHLGSTLRLSQLEGDIERLKLLKQIENWLVNGGDEQALLELISK